MEYNENIKVFRLIAEINLPLAEDPSEIVDCNEGNLLVSFNGNDVYAQDHSMTNYNMALLTINLDFVLNNPQFFEELT